MIRALLDWFIRRRNPYRSELRELCQERIEIDEFRRRCMARWVENNGPVPEGRVLVVEVLNGSLRVGHTERLPGDELGGDVWKFKSLAAKLKPFHRYSLGRFDLPISDQAVIQQASTGDRELTTFPMFVSIKVHALRHGQPLCGFDPRVPADWPEGHAWID